MGALQIVKQLKQAGQDYEWYPTTREIIEAMYWDLLGKKEGRHFSLLDIGAGNCKVLNTIQEIANEQPLLEEYFQNGEYKSQRKEDERLANRIIIRKYMAIEKSQILINQMPKEALVVGVDFNENTLIDKPTDIVFCNPPYSEYERWSEKIIREANAKHIYLVIPQRWGKHKGIAQALKDRKAKAKIIGNFDFLNAEDRKARAKVSLVKISLVDSKWKKNGRYDYYAEDKQKVDPFELWFHSFFKINAQQAPDDWGQRDKKYTSRKEEIKNELVGGRDLVSVLVQLYNKKLDKLIGNYQKLSELDADLLKELNVDVASVLGAFREKIEGLKNFYWEEVFANFEMITSRLTSKTRARLQTNLMANTSIDFNESNIRSVVLWVVKNASTYFEAQMLELYDEFTTEEGIKLYKSNQHFVKDNFRFNRREGKLNKYALDYRIVLHNYLDSWAERQGTISENQFQNIKDLVVIAKNLGYQIDTDILNMSRAVDTPYFKFGGKDNLYFEPSSMRILKKGTKTVSGKIEEVYMHTMTPNENGERVMEKDSVIYVYSDDNKQDWIQYKIGEMYLDSRRVVLEADIFTTVKGFKNGNTHYQISQEFMKKFNLEVGRIRNWLRDPVHAAEELDISVEEAAQYWNSSFTLLPSNMHELLPNFKLDVVEAEEEEIQGEEEDNAIVVEEKSEIANNQSFTYDEDLIETFQSGTLF